MKLTFKTSNSVLIFNSTSDNKEEEGKERKKERKEGNALNDTWSHTRVDP
jgi:hypothetical protein